MFQVGLKVISSSFKGVSRAFERGLKGMLEKSQQCFKGISMVVSRAFLESFKGNVKIFSRVSHGSLKVFLREF